MRRQEILKAMRIPFKVATSTYRERWCRKTAPEILTVRHAVGKAQKAVLPPKARFVLGGDTLVWYRGHGFGKPKNRAEALRILRELNGRQHEVYTGLALLDRKTKCVIRGYAKTRVQMKRCSEAWLQKYADTIHPFDKAGAYAIQARMRIVQKIRGSYSNVVGLPKELLQQMIRQMSRMTDLSVPPFKKQRSRD